LGIKRQLVNRFTDLLALALKVGGRQLYRHVVSGLWQRAPFWESDEGGISVQLHCPAPLDPDPADRDLAARVFQAFQLAKAAETRQEAVFRPSPGWQNVIDSAYAPLREGLEQDALDPVHYFLTNFRSWKEATGLEPSRLLHEYSRSAEKRQHYENRIITPLVNWWLKSESHGRGIESLCLPRHGNPAGALVNGQLIDTNAVFYEVYGRVLADLVEGDRPIIAELGGGYGKLFHFTARNLGNHKYLAFDLPETLCLSSYFLMKSFPDRRFLLYGEAPFDESSLEEYDFLMLPSFEIVRLPNRRVDLFVNEDSLNSMGAATCQRFVQEICRTADAFWHRNTEATRFAFADGTSSMIPREYPIPEDQFRRLVRYPDINRLMCDGRLNFENDMCWYYYTRR
jgi:putative sugar O-methyltransferase